MSDKDDWYKFFEEALSSIDLHDTLTELVKKDLYGGTFLHTIKYRDPKLQLIYEVIES